MNGDKMRRYLAVVRDTVYSEPEEGNFHNELIKQAVSEFLPLFSLSDAAVVLDAGCGPGVFMDCLRDQGRKAVGVTLSQEDVAACRAKGHECLLSDIGDVPLDSGSVELVWARHAIEHSVAPFLALLEFNRLLSDGGGVYLEVPAAGLTRRHEWNPNHYAVMGIDMWAALLVRAGFEVFRTANIEFDLSLNGRVDHEVFHVLCARKCSRILDMS